jgi:signal transduction histidine kinase
VGGADSPEGIDVQQAVDAAFTASARRWERTVVVVRVVICLVMIVRSALIWNRSSLAIEVARAWLTAPMLVVAVLYIGTSIAVARSQGPIERALKISVALDTAVAFLALLPNVLWPWPGYPGIANTPDIAALTMATLAAGLRLSPGAALLGGILNSACFGALVLVDLQISGMPPGTRGHQILLQGTFLAGAMVMSIMIAVRTRHLAERAARAVLTAERTRRSFGEILHEHHDVRTLLSAARLNADRLAGTGTATLGSIVDDLRSDLDDVEARLNAIRELAYGELLTLQVVHTVDVVEVTRSVLERLGRRFPAVVLRLHTDERVEAEVAGGDATLRRLLFNLVINACEGDGVRGATHVDVNVRSDCPRQRVQVQVCDDGPGFAPELLGTRLGETRSTKAGGSGFGLRIALALAQASGGTLTRENAGRGGAVVSLSLPMAVSRSNRETGSI